MAVTEPQPQTSDRVASIRAALSTLEPTEVMVKDQSHLHAGHTGAADGRGHYEVRIVATRFEGLNAIQRHRLVYAAMGELMQSDIHALQIRAATPTEARSRQTHSTDHTKD